MGGGDLPHPILGVLQPDEKIGILHFESVSHILKAESDFYPKKGNEYVSDCTKSRSMTKQSTN